MIAEGILPSNEGRGYVLRRILRRAVRHGRLLGIEREFLADIVDTVVTMYSEPYPDLMEKRSYIIKVVQMEEQRFQETLAQGMELLAKHIAELEQAGKKVFNGATAFKLYDTFGFPWELTQEILDDHNMQLDKAAFDQEMNEQRERARAARQENEERIVFPDLSGVVTENLSYDCHAHNAKLLLVFKEGKIIDAAHDGAEVGLILDVTPFYAEGGGQVGDTGFITGPVGKVQITNTKKLPDGTIYHIGNVIEGSVKAGDAVKVAVDEQRRQAAARNHTATHLLQAALQRVLGSHVNQAGSSVGQIGCGSIFHILPRLRPTN
jgi:alanyl-tRNA synthetase